MTHISKCLLHDTEVNLAPMILAQNNQQLLEPWHDLSECVHEGAFPSKIGSRLRILGFHFTKPSIQQLVQ